MSKPIPPVQKYMTTSPFTIEADEKLAAAANLMRENRIRHLPVMRGGSVAGILSARDVALIETLKDVDPKAVSVEDAMTPSPYVVSPDTLVSEVAAEMAEHKYGAVIVAQNHKVVGVFTTVDVCRVLSEVFETRLR